MIEVEDEGKVNYRRPELERSSETSQSTLHFTNEDVGEERRGKGFTPGRPASQQGHQEQTWGFCVWVVCVISHFLIFCIFVFLIPCPLNGTSSCLQSVSPDCLLAFKNFYLFLAASGLGYGMQDLSLRHAGFSLVVAGAPEHKGSVVAARGLSSCGVQA